MRGAENGSQGGATPTGGPARAAAEREQPPDVAALADQLAALRPPLLALGRRLTRDEHAAEDVVQNAFEKVFLHARTFEGRSSLRTWVWRVATNQAIDLHRTRAREQRLQEALVARAVEPLVATFESPCEAIQRRRRAEAIREAMASLSTRDREILAFWASSDRAALTQRGAKGGTCARTLRTHLFRARQRLRRALNECP